MVKPREHYFTGALRPHISVAYFKVQIVRPDLTFSCEKKTE